LCRRIQATVNRESACPGVDCVLTVTSLLHLPRHKQSTSRYPNTAHSSSHGDVILGPTLPAVDHRRSGGLDVTMGHLDEALKKVRRSARSPVVPARGRGCPDERRLADARPPRPVLSALWRRIQGRRRAQTSANEPNHGANEFSWSHLSCPYLSSQNCAIRPGSPKFLGSMRDENRNSATVDQEPFHIEKQSVSRAEGTGRCNGRDRIVQCASWPFAVSSQCAAVWLQP
jgi:hypothetical protein